MRCSNVPADVGPVELSQHFAAFGSVVDMRLRAVTAENGSKGQKEALVQFASANQAQACVSVSNYASRFHFPRVPPRLSCPAFFPWVVPFLECNGEP